MGLASFQTIFQDTGGMYDSAYSYHRVLVKQFEVRSLHSHS